MEMHLHADKTIERSAAEDRGKTSRKFHGAERTNPIVVSSTNMVTQYDEQISPEDQEIASYLELLESVWQLHGRPFEQHAETERLEDLYLHED